MRRLRVASTPRSRRFALLLVAAAAALLRVAYVAEVHRHPYYFVPLVDAADYQARAVQVMRGAGLGGDAFYKAPAYEYLVGQLYRLTGPRLGVVYALQMLGGVLVATLVAALAMRWFGLWAGTIAGLLAGLYAPLVYFENQLLIESSALVFSVVAVALLVASHRTWSDVAAGVAAGVALQLRPVNVALVAALLLWLLLRREAWRLRLRRAAALCLPVLLLLLPTLRHNRIATGHLVPISVNGGINFYIGNNPDYDATVAIRPGLRWEALTERFGPLDDPYRWQQGFYRAAFDYIRSQPLDYARLLGKKLVLFWNAREIDRNQDSAAMYGDSDVLRRLALPWAVVASLGLVGLVATWRRAARVLPVHALVLVQMVGVLAFFVTSRYRLVAVPWLAVAGGAAAADLMAALVSRHAKRALQLAAGLLAALVFVLPDYDGLARRPFGRPEFDRAEVLARRGDQRGALHAFELALARHPEDPDVCFRYGAQLERLGRRDAALQQYRRATDLAPWSYKPPLALGAAYLEAGALDSAWVALDVAARRGDPHGRVLYDMALVREGQGRYAEALDLYRRSVQQRDEPQELALRRLGAGRALILLRRPEAADVEFAVAAQLLQDPLVVPLERAEAWLRAGESRRALAALQQLPDLDRSARGCFIQARALAAEGMLQQARFAAQRAVQLDSTSSRYRAGLRDLDLKLGHVRPTP